MLYVEVTYHFNEQVDFKISSKLIQDSKVKKICPASCSTYATSISNKKISLIGMKLLL